MQWKLIGVLLGIVLFWYSCSDYPGNVDVGPNRLRPTQVEVVLNELTEFDGLTKDEIFEFRTKRVNEYPELYTGVYRPNHKVFGQILDGKFWWGIRGQFCHGPGKKSDDGPSEESRFLGNPYLLLGIGESLAFKNISPCVVAYPEPLSLKYQENMAKVVYDFTAFAAQVKKAKRSFSNRMMLHNYNARDWGYNWVFLHYADGVKRSKDSALFDEPIPLKAYIHTGRSCAKKGGCNNGSPYEPDLYFSISAIPAKLHLYLWKEKPASTSKEPDFQFHIILE